MRKFLSHIIFICTLVTCTAFAQDNISDSLKLINGISDPAKKIYALNSLAKRLRTRNFDECIRVSGVGLKEALKTGNLKAAGDFKIYTGEAFYLKGNYDSAASFFYQAIDFMNRSEDASGKAAVLNSLGRLYRKTKDLDRALQNYDEAFSIYSKLNDEEGMATILNESGVVFEYKADYAEAISRYQRSLAIREKMNDLLGKSYSLNFIGGAYTLMKKYDEAEKYLKESLEIRKQLKDTFTLALSYSDLGAMYFSKQDYDKAAQQYLESNKIAESMKYPQLLSDNYLTLSSIEEKKGNNALSLQYFKSHSALKDSIMNMEKISQIETLNAKYQAEKKEQQLLMQGFELKQKNYLLTVVSSIAILFIMGIFSFYQKKQARNRLAMQEAIMKQQEEAARAIIEAEENERKRIAADLHDGIGQMMSAAKMNLSVFESELNFSNDQQKASFENALGMIDESCREIRSVSHQMMPNALLKSGLTRALQEFIDKIDHRLIQVSLHTEGLEERINNNIETVLYRVIQECVNNVLKHAEASRLDISLINDKDGIAATIEDNGKGFDSSNNQHVDGIGMKNILSRVSYLKGTIEFDSSPGKGTLVAIHIPVG